VQLSVYRAIRREGLDGIAIMKEGEEAAFEDCVFRAEQLICRRIATKGT
jgi:hypothetical protein